MKRSRLLLFGGLLALASLLAGVGMVAARRRRSVPVGAGGAESDAALLLPVPASPPRPWWRRLAHFLLAPLLLGLVFPARLLWRALRGLWAARVGWWRVGAGLAALALLTAANVGMIALTQHVQMALLCAGVALFAWGIGDDGMKRGHVGGGGTTPALSGAAAFGRGKPRPYVWVMAAIVLGALALRVWRLDTAVQYFIDEWHPSRAIIRLWDAPTTPLLTHYDEIGRFTGVYPYLQALALEVFLSPLFGLRIISALVGGLSIAAGYMLARVLFPARQGAAISAALLLATFPPHLHFSRIGLNNIADPLVACLGFAALLRGLHSGSRAAFVLAGVMLGLTQYFYEGGRLLYPALFAAWVVGLALAAWLTKGRGGGQMSGVSLRWGMLALMALVGLVVAAPVLLTWWQHGLSFTPRLEITRSPARDLQLLPPLLHLFAFPDGSPFYGGTTPLMLIYVAVPFFGGLLTLLRRPFAPPALLLLPWIAGTMIGNGLLESADESARFVVLFPALALIAAVGVAALLAALLDGTGRIAGRIGGRARPAPASATRARWVVIAALVIAAAQTVYYFGPHLAYYNDQVRRFDNDPAMKDHQDVFFRALSLPPGTPILVITDGVALISDYDTLNRLYHADIEAAVVAPFDVAAHVDSLPLDRTYAIFAETDAPWWNEVELALLAHFALSEPQFSPFNVPPERQYGLVLAVPRGEAAQ